LCVRGRPRLLVNFPVGGFGGAGGFGSEPAAAGTDGSPSVVVGCTVSTSETVVALLPSTDTLVEGEEIWSGMAAELMSLFFCSAALTTV